MKKILFLIHDLGRGGAEKVLVNLANNLDKNKFDVTIMVLFGGGTNKQFLDETVHYKEVFPKMIPGNSQLMKLLSPKQLHRMFIKNEYDIEVSYLEGSPARVISGCELKKTKLVSWIHVAHKDINELAYPFRNKKEMLNCYESFDQTVCVSKYVQDNFKLLTNCRNNNCVLYNTVETEKIVQLSQENVDLKEAEECVKLVAVGTLKKSKGYDRLLRVINRLKKEEYKFHLYILGVGGMKDILEKYVHENLLDDMVTFIGYDVNPYKYVSRCDLFLCASYSEGFSTAATEALIVGTPVCTVNVSGMKEMLGDNNEYGIVTENNEHALYEGIKQLLDSPELRSHYKKQAKLRGEKFDTKSTVRAVEEMFDSL